MNAAVRAMAWVTVGLAGCGEVGTAGRGAHGPVGARTNWVAAAAAAREGATAVRRKWIVPTRVENGGEAVLASAKATPGGAVLLLSDVGESPAAAADDRPAVERRAAADARQDGATSSGAPVRSTALPESAEASIDGAIRFVPTTNPTQPEPQRPPASTPENTDTNKPVHEWQRATDDWAGARPWLDDHGVSFQASLTLDYSKNLAGGITTRGDAFRHLLNANVTVDTEKLLGWKGGTVFANFQNQAGRNGSTELTGDVQMFSNIDADGRTQVSELWFEQKLWDEKLRVRVGKIDANTEFARVENSGAFLNGSFGGSPTILFMPKYPDSAVGIDLFVKPVEWMYVGVGVFDGALQEGVRTGERGPATALGSPADLFVVAEAGVTWKLAGGRGGRAAVGVWHDTGRLARFDGGTMGGATGPYVVVEQTVWRENPGDENDSQGIAAFFQYGYADPAVSAFEHHVGGGLTWTGPVAGRDDDVLGLGATWVKLSGAAGAGFEREDELSVEMFYRAKVLKWLSVQPDVQYIRHPGGGAHDDAVVATVRVVMDL